MKPIKGYRPATLSDIGWGKKIYLRCGVGRRDTFHPVTIEKLTHRQIGAKVGENDFQHRERVKEINRKIADEIKSVVTSGNNQSYYVKDSSNN